jgi:hypothetical protein
MKEEDCVLAVVCYFPLAHLGDVHFTLRIKEEKVSVRSRRHTIWQFETVMPVESQVEKAWQGKVEREEWTDWTVDELICHLKHNRIEA